MNDLNANLANLNTRIIGHYINGKHFVGAGSRLSPVYNPATGEVSAQSQGQCKSGFIRDNKLPIADKSALTY
jgi:hypothetical protein